MQDDFINKGGHGLSLPDFALAPLHERDFRVIPQANNGVENAKSGPAEPIRSPQT